MKNNQTNNIDEKLDEVLLKFRRSMTEALNKEAKESGFSLSHFEVLVSIAEHGSITMKEVATLLNITPPSASVLVDKLVEMNMVKRIQSNEDRRTVEITLEDKAHNLFRSVHRKRMCMFKKTISGLDDKDKEDLIRILNKCVVNY
jgi:DNA-binding MarR family transcriptional regulator